MTQLEEFLKMNKREIQECYSKGIKWLVNSEIRDREGGYKSEYNPRIHAYTVWGGGDNCILNTAGTIMTLLGEPRLQDLAVQSARYLQRSIVKSPEFFTGCLVAGNRSLTVFPNYIGWVILALSNLYRRTKDATLLESASTLADWLVSHSQRPDGRIYDSLSLKEGGTLTKFREAVGRSYSTWHAVLIWALIEAAKLRGDEHEYDAFNSKLLAWLERAQTPEGAVRSQLWGRGSVVYQAVTRGRVRLLSDNWDKKMHPTSAVLCFQAFRLMREHKRETNLVKWLIRAIGGGGLFYQFYWNNHHSAEEDVMPTALFAKLLIEYGVPEAENTAIRTIQGILRSQIHSEDPNANGGIKGLPMHTSLGESAFSWDTQFSLMLIQAAWDSTGLRPLTD